MAGLFDGLDPEGGAGRRYNDWPRATPPRRTMDIG